MYNNLQESIFDSIFTAALSEYMISENNTFSDEEATKMYPFSEKKLRIYKRKAKEKKYNLSMPLVFLRRVAIVFLVIVSASFGVLITNKDVRAAVRNAIIKWHDGYVQISFPSTDDNNNTPQTTDNNESDTTNTTENIPETAIIPDLKDLKIGYIPSGFELQSSDEDNNERNYIYMDDAGNYIMIIIARPDIVDFAVDSEYTTMEEMYINGNESYVFYSTLYQMSVVISGNSKYTFQITACCTKEETIKIAENIK